MLRVVFLICVYDYPVNGNLSCELISGYKACIKCADEIDGLFLSELKKIVYMGYYKWLEMKDPWRDDKKNFNGRAERWYKLSELTGYEVYEIVRGFEV
ncbi:hypothetical protein EHS16_07800, partial [Streptococcus anginosus]